MPAALQADRRGRCVDGAVRADASGRFDLAERQQRFARYRLVDDAATALQEQCLAEPRAAELLGRQYHFYGAASVRDVSADLGWAHAGDAVFEPRSRAYTRPQLTATSSALVIGQLADVRGRSLDRRVLPFACAAQSQQRQSVATRIFIDGQEGQ